MVEDSYFEDEEGEEGEEGDLEVEDLKGVAARKEANDRRYRQGANGKKAVKRYNDSVPAREARARYVKSPKGQLALERSYRKHQARQKILLTKLKQMEEWESKGLCGLCGGVGHVAASHIGGEEHDRVG